MNTPTAVQLREKIEELESEVRIQEAILNHFIYKRWDVEDNIRKQTQKLAGIKEQLETLKNT